MSDTYVRATPSGIEFLALNITSIRRRLLMIELSQEPIPIHILFNQIRIKRGVPYELKTLAQDLEMLQYAGHVKVYQ